jgi:hypothetical protein
LLKKHTEEDDAYKFDMPEVRGPRKRVAEEPLPDAPSIKKPIFVPEMKATEPATGKLNNFSLK